MSVEDRLDAAEMLAEEGQSVVLTYLATGGTYDPATTSDTGGTTPDPQAVKGAILPLSPFRKSQGNIVEGDQQLLLSALNTSGVAISAPVVGAKITDANGEPWNIIAVEPLAPAGLTIMFDCIVRRAA